MNHPIHRVFLISCIALVQFCVGMSGSRSVAQETNLAEPLKRILSTPDAAVIPNRNNLQQALRELQKESEQLRKRLAGGGSSTKTIERAPRDSTTEADATRDINQRIRLLRSLYANKQPTSLPPAKQVPRGSMTRQTAGTDPRDLTLPPVVAPSIEQMLPADATESVSQNDSSDQNVLAAQSSVLTAERVLPAPVNILEMANSLFETGNIAAAADAYEAVDRAETTAFDTIWVDFMEASCRRRLQDFESAEATLREIANNRSAGHLVNVSRWWLKHIQSSQDSKAAYQRLSQEADALLERARNYDTE